MEHDADILIVGGGLSGPLLALALAREGLHSVVVDALPRDIRAAPGFDGRAYALALAAQRMFARLGLWEALADHAQPMLEIKITDGRPGQPPAPFFLHFDHAEIEEGPMGYMIEDRHLRGLLLDRMEAEPLVTPLSGVRVVAQATDGTGATLNLDDGRALRGRLIAGCDGRASGTAERAGIKRRGWPYGQTALVCAIEHERPHGGVAHQLFLPAGPLAILPLPGNRSAIVWSERAGRAAEIQAMDPEAYLDALRGLIGDFLGPLALVGERFTYPLSLSLATAFHADRVALVADAAHGMHPIAGQGLNAGLRDIAALAQVLGEARRRGEDVGAELVLRRYGEWRRFDTATLALATDTFNRLFSNDNPLLRAGRDLGLGIVNAMPGLRRSFIREAAGLTGELPELMRG